MGAAYIPVIADPDVKQPLRANEHHWQKHVETEITIGYMSPVSWMVLAAMKLAIPPEPNTDIRVYRIRPATVRRLQQMVEQWPPTGVALTDAEWAQARTAGYKATRPALERKARAALAQHVLRMQDWLRAGYTHVLVSV